MRVEDALAEVGVGLAAEHAQRVCMTTGEFVEWTVDGHEWGRRKARESMSDYLSQYGLTPLDAQVIYVEEMQYTDHLTRTTSYGWYAIIRAGLHMLRL